MTDDQILIHKHITSLVAAIDHHYLVGLFIRPIDQGIQRHFQHVGAVVGANQNGKCRHGLRCVRRS